MDFLQKTSIFPLFKNSSGSIYVNVETEKIADFSTF